MFNKPLKDLEFKDIEELTKSIDRNEGYKFDFKGAPDNPDKFEDKLIQSFTAFANAYGGYLILGVNEIDKKNKTFELKGFPQIIKGKNTIEWINQVISGNVEPKLFYSDPKSIEIPDSDKIILVYFIPESSVKPHMNNKEGKYYIRINDKSEPAKHYTVRDMFETSRRRYDELNIFLEKRNLLNEESESFGLNSNSKSLKSDVFKVGGLVPMPLLLYSFIPKLPVQEITNVQSDMFANWIKANESGYEPLNRFPVFSTHKNEINLDGITFKNYLERAYTEFQNNGFFEAGICDSVFYIWPRDSESKIPTIHITWTIGYLITLLNFAKKYYDYIKYEDEIILQLSFKNVFGFTIVGFNEMKVRYDLRNSRYISKNKFHINFKIIERFNPNNLNNDTIIQIAKHFGTKALYAFGLNNETLCFVDNQIDINLYSHIKDIL
jgi:hypothetical protein